MSSESKIDPYIVVAHFQNLEPYVPEREMEIDLVNKLKKMEFEPYQIRILFERFKQGKLMLEVEEVFFSSQLRHKSSPHERLMKVFTDKYHIDFNNNFVTNRMKGVKNLQKYVQYLKEKKIEWTYLNVYYESSKIKIGSIYSDEPIPERMIE